MSSKTKKPDLWMPWYIADYLADTTHLSAAEHGAYLLMLAHAWMNNGALPLEDERLCRLTRMSAVEWELSKGVLMRFWTAEDDGYVQKRLRSELLKAKNMQDQRVKAGLASANVRWGNGKGNKR